MVDMEIFKTWLNSKEALVEWIEFAYPHTVAQTQVDGSIINSSGAWLSWSDSRGGSVFWAKLHREWGNHYNAYKENKYG